MAYALQIGSYGSSADALAMKNLIIHNLLRIPDDVRNATAEDITPAPPQTSWTELATSTITDSYTGTSAASLASLTATGAWTKSKFLWVHIRDTAGKRNGYFYGSDSVLVNINAANGSTTTMNFIRVILSVDGSGNYTQYIGTSTTGYGVYPLDVSNTGVIRMRHRYNATNSRTIDGTYKISVYALDPNTGDTVLA